MFAIQLSKYMYKVYVSNFFYCFGFCVVSWITHLVSWITQRKLCESLGTIGYLADILKLAVSSIRTYTVKNGVYFVECIITPYTLIIIMYGDTSKGVETPLLCI